MLLQQSIKTLTIEQVIEKMGIGRTKLYSLVKEGGFPEPIKIGRCSRWIESEVDEWLLNLMNKRKPLIG